MVPADGVALQGPGAWEDLLASGEAAQDWQDVAVAASAPAFLLSTSGTTGRSKIVVWSHATLAALHLAAAPRGIARGEVFPLITPFMHGAGIYYLLNALTQRATAALVETFDAGVVLDVMQAQSCTSVFGLPFMCGALAEEQAARPREITALRSATVAGDTCPGEVEERFSAVFGLPLLSFWAAAEDVGATVPSERVGPFMQLIPQAHARVVDGDGADVASGQVGELVIASPTTVPGYWGEHGEVTALAEGVFRSGDLVRDQGEGVLQYAGRLKDLIVRAGSNISPGEVEEALRKHRAVIDAAVVGLPDAQLGQRVGALLVLDEAAGVAPQQVLADVGQSLSAYKVPERVVQVDSIPRNALTKVDRAASARTLEEQSSAPPAGAHA